MEVPAGPRVRTARTRPCGRGVGRTRARRGVCGQDHRPEAVQAEGEIFYAEVRVRVEFRLCLLIGGGVLRESEASPCGGRSKLGRFFITLSRIFFLYFRIFSYIFVDLGLPQLLGNDLVKVFGLGRNS